MELNRIKNQIFDMSILIRKKTCILTGLILFLGATCFTVTFSQILGSFPGRSSVSSRSCCFFDSYACSASTAFFIWETGIRSSIRSSLAITLAREGREEICCWCEAHTLNQKNQNVYHCLTASFGTLSNLDFHPRLNRVPLRFHKPRALESKHHAIVACSSVKSLYPATNFYGGTTALTWLKRHRGRAPESSSVITPVPNTFHLLNPRYLTPCRTQQQYLLSLRDSHTFFLVI